MKTFDEAFATVISEADEGLESKFYTDLNQQMYESFTNEAFKDIIHNCAVQCMKSMHGKDGITQLATICSFMQTMFENGRRVGIEMEKL